MSLNWGEQEERMWERLRWLMAGDEPRRLSAAQATCGQSHLQGEVEDALLFLEILQVRFQRRVEVAIHLHPDVCAFRLPRLLLHAIFENVMRHGFAPGSRAGRMEVTARPDGEAVLIQIELDSGNSIRFLQGAGSLYATHVWSLFGDAARIRTQTGAHGGMRVEVRIPTLYPVEGPGG